MGHKILEVFLFDSIMNFESECIGYRQSGEQRILYPQQIQAKYQIVSFYGKDRRWLRQKMTKYEDGGKM